MDFSRIKKIKSYVQQIKKFRSLESHKNTTNDEFFILMKSIFPKFQKEFPQLFKNVIYNRDMNILDVMFKKLDDISHSNSWGILKLLHFAKASISNLLILLTGILFFG